MNAEDQKLVDNIMDWFDFSSMEKMMRAVDFGWTKDIEDFSEPILRVFVRNKIMEAHEEFLKSDRDSFLIEIGGIRVKWLRHEDGQTELIVEADLVSWNACSDYV